MRAVGLDFENRTVRELELPEAREPGPGEVLLRIHEVGVCATDRELAHFRFGIPPPGESVLGLGHEALAEVVAAGPGVESLSRGDWVVPSIRRACQPPCVSCLEGRYDLCRTDGYLERGITRAHGYFTAFVTDPAEAVIRVPVSLLDVAVLAEPLSVVEKAIETALRVHPAEARRASVIGAGPVGLLTALALQIRAIEVTVVSIEPEDHPRVQLLRRAGIPYLREAAPPVCDIVFEASGAESAALAAPHWLAPCGVLVLIGAADTAVPVPCIRMVVHNLTVTGVVNAARRHFEAALGDLSRIPAKLLEPMILRRPFDEWRESLASAPAIPKVVHRF